MGLDSCKLIKGRIPDSSQTRPLWHTLTAHSLKFLLSATTEGVQTWRRGGGGGVRERPIPRRPGSPFRRRTSDNFPAVLGWWGGVVVGGGRGEREKKRGEIRLSPLATSIRRLGLRSCGCSPRSPLHPINGNSPHLLLWRFKLAGCLGPASARTCAQQGECGTEPRIPWASQTGR